MNNIGLPTCKRMHLKTIQAANYCMKEKELSENEFFDQVQGKTFANQQNRVVAIECPDPKDNSTCLYIVDRIGYLKDGSWFVGRFLTPVPNLTKGFLSVSKLVKPVFKSMSTIDTAMWMVDVGTMDAMTPNSVELSSLFTTGHFEMNRDVSGNITFLGVATGGLMSFFSTYFKNLKLTGIDIDPQSEYLAKKWFGYRDTKNSKILIGDGAEYIMEMAKRGETSDAVLVDACHNHAPPDGIYCPVEAVRTPEFLKSLSAVIGTKGITTYNMYILHRDHQKGYQKIRNEFAKYFAECHLGSNHLGNAFIMCSNNKIDQSTVDISSVRSFLKNMRIDGFLKNLL
ncbi:hypothetical protein B9Z55_001341 [Caenorhabditis nigoni]|uniref:PABS domain-containing protein n=1 Tax=Caenorhabditis nigoni TaxID=1611254 RepID=A0A2G5VF98_9PELO|nr:hypothetical protein B9Z55_001341 [Caenorhabditis nigoni]